MNHEDVERRFRIFERGHEPALVKLASHAALPVALNPDFLHLLRVNYFLDPPEALPYTAEAELLLSPLCKEVDQGLYVIDPDMRDVLLQRLIEESGGDRLRDVARLLWEYGQRSTPWRPGLSEAQQLTALNFIDPARARDWLAHAEGSAGPGTAVDERWFVAMGRDLEDRAAAVRRSEALARTMHETAWGPAISRRNPGCIVILLDRSDSMEPTWANSQETLAEGAARVVNEILLELIFTSQGEPGRVRHYFDVGVFGYGIRPVAGGEGVEPAFGGKLAGQPLVALPDLRDNPAAIREIPSLDHGAPPRRVPVWVEPAHGYGRPLCQAIAVSGKHVYEWASAHPDSFPPIIINITAGMVTDSPYEGATLAEWTQRLFGIHTFHGPVLFFNIFLSPLASSSGVLFPATDYGLPDPGPQLFRISSVLPPPMVANLQSTGTVLEPGARGFGFNADATMLIRSLEIGTAIEIA